MEAFLPLAGSRGLYTLRTQMLRPGQTLNVFLPLAQSSGRSLRSPSAVSFVGCEVPDLIQGMYPVKVCSRIKFAWSLLMYH